MQAAFRALAANGYQASSLASIAADAGLTTPGLLHHFPSKNELLLALLEERDRLDEAGSGLGEARGIAALDCLQELADKNAANLELVRAFAVLVGESVSTDHPARRWAQARYAKLRRELVAALHRGVVDGEVRDDVDLEAIAAEIVAMMDGLQIQWVLDPGQIDMSQVLTHYFQGLAEHLRRQT
jgi:AcrR family transcriptional regulator